MNQEVLAETPAPEQVETASPESVDTSAPEVVDTEQKPEAKEQKVFTQEELDAAIGKRLAREQRKWEREQAQRQAEMQYQPQTQSALSIEQFSSPEEYAEALAVQKAQELLAKQQQQKAQQEFVEAYHEKEEAAREKYDDFVQVAYNPNVAITQVMAESIQTSDIGPDIAYFLGSNPKEADRISQLSPILQAKEIGKIEAKLTAEPPKAKKTSNAPAPIAPIHGKGGNSPSIDTTDPRSDSLSTAEWMRLEEARLRKKLSARA